MGLKRHPAFAGQFYPSDASKLSEMIVWAFSESGAAGLPSPNPRGERRITGVVSPHAGYIYSGPTAAAGYSLLASDGKPSTFLVIGPNHSGLGSPVSVMGAGVWSTPLGTVGIDAGLASELSKRCNLLSEDAYAHSTEHSIEVQLPFLQAIYGEEFQIVPIAMVAQDLETARELGKAIALSIEAVKKHVVVIASSDLTHYEPQTSVAEKDNLAIEAILKLDEEELFNRVVSHNISMCGFGPVMTALVASKLMGAKTARLVDHRTSGDMTGDYSAVVGYASLVMMK